MPIRLCPRPSSSRRRSPKAASPICTCRRNSLRCGIRFLADMSYPFVALVQPREAVSAPAHWFLFQGSQLLVRREEGRASVPFVEGPQALGLEPVRTQYLGLLAGQHCYSAECTE